MRSLRTSILWCILGTSAGAVAVLAALFLYRVSARRAAVAEIEELGGVVTEQYQGPVWIGENGRLAHFFYRPRSVNFATSTVTLDRRRIRELTGRLQRFGRLRRLLLTNLPIEDGDLCVLQNFPHLEVLDLSSTRVTDEGLEQVGRLKDLRSLQLANTRVSDAGLEHLSGLPRLESVILDGTDVTDRGMVHLRRLPNLQELSVSNTAVTEDGLARLAEGIPRLAVSDD